MSTHTHLFPLILVGFCGPISSGKSSAAKHLAAHHGFTRISFADPLRQMLAALTDVETEYTERKNDPRPELCGKSVRQTLQTLGTEWGRDLVGHDLWLRQMHRRIHQLYVPGQVTKITIDDVRFDNEAELIRDHGGILLEVESRGLPASEAAHVSERGIDLSLITARVPNGDLPTLFTNVESLLRSRSIL